MGTPKPQGPAPCGPEMGGGPGLGFSRWPYPAPITELWVSLPPSPSPRLRDWVGSGVRSKGFHTSKRSAKARGGWEALV